MAEFRRTCHSTTAIIAVESTNGCRLSLLTKVVAELVSNSRASIGGLRRAGLAGARAAGVVDDDRAGKGGAACIAEAYCDVGAAGAAIGTIGDMGAAFGAHDGLAGGLLLIDGDQRFVVIALVIGVAVLKYDPAALPGCFAAAGLDIFARAQHDVVAAGQRTRSCKVEAGHQAVAGATGLGALHHAAKRRQCGASENADYDQYEQEFDQRDTGLTMKFAHCHDDSPSQNEVFRSATNSRQQARVPKWTMNASPCRKMPIVQVRTLVMCGLRPNIWRMLELQILVRARTAQPISWEPQ